MTTAIAFSASAFAQAYPSKPIRIIVPFSAGGSTDQLARALQKPLSEALGQPVIVDNKPGAGGAIGVELVAKSAPDGYTLVFGNSGPSAVVSLMRKVPYDPIKDFQPISMVAIAPLALVASNALPARDFKEFLASARKAGSKLNFGSVGNGSMSHLTGEYLNDFAGISVQHVPYNGGATLGTAVLAGEIETAWVNPLDGTTMVASGKARYLAVATPRRIAALPDVPTVAEFLPGFDSSAWFGILAPAGTPAAIVQKLHEAVASSVARPDVRRVLEQKMVEPRSSTPEELQRRIQLETETWAPIIRKYNIKL